MPTNLTALMNIGVEALFFILLFFFSIHALFLTYHWFAYGTSRQISLIALAAYLAGGAVLFVTFSLALNML